MRTVCRMDVPGIRTAAIRLPKFGVLAERDRRIHGAQSDRLMAVLRVASAVVLDAGNALLGRNLIKQPWQDRRPILLPGAQHEGKSYAYDGDVTEYGEKLITSL